MVRLRRPCDRSLTVQATFTVAGRSFTISAAQLAAEPDSEPSVRARQSSGTFELVGVDARLTHIWLRWLDGDLSLAVKAIGRRSKEDTLRLLLLDARKLGIVSLATTLEARFRRVAAVAQQAISTSESTSAPAQTTPSARTGVAVAQPARQPAVATSGIAVAQPSASSLPRTARTGFAVAQPAVATTGYAVAQPAATAQLAVATTGYAVAQPAATSKKARKGKRGGQASQGGSGGLTSQQPSAPVKTAGPSKAKASNGRRASAQQTFWSSEPLLQTLRAAMWDSIEGHVALSQVNRTMRRLYTGKDPDYTDASEPFWAQICGRRGFGIARHGRKAVPPQPWRCTAAAIVHHARKCPVSRCRQQLTMSCARSCAQRHTDARRPFSPLR